MSFTAIQPCYDDMKAYARGFFPQTVLGNHVQWAMDYLNIAGEIDPTDCYPKYRMYLADASNLYMEKLYYE